MKKTWIQTINQLKLVKWSRRRWGKGEMVEESKKKYNRRRDNERIDPERFIEGTEDDY